MENILVVDSNNVHALLMSWTIEDMNYQPIIANSIEKAEQRFNAQKFDLVLIDIYHRNKNEFFRLIKKIRKSKSEQKIIITSTYDKDEIEKLIKERNIQVQGILSKPFNVEEATRLIKQVLKL